MKLKNSTEEKNYRNKLLMMVEEDSPDPTKGVDFVKNEVLVSIEEKGGKISERAELQHLKNQLGTWSLAPLLVKPAPCGRRI